MCCLLQGTVISLSLYVVENLDKHQFQAKAS